MIRIFIENFELDINKNLSNQITYAIDDIRNLDSKSTPFTKTIILPGTAKNNTLLGNIFEFNNSNFTSDVSPNVKYNFNASKSAKCRIECDGMKMIKGVFRLMEIIIDGNNVEYECSVFGELGGFSNKLGALTLNDLDFSAYDHDWSLANITAGWTNDNTGAGVYYPLIDYGAVSNAKHDFLVQAFKPALFVKEYIDKIFTMAGYTYDCDLFNTDRFKRLIIPHNQKTLFKNTTHLVNAEAHTEQYILQNPTATNEMVWDSSVLSNFTMVGNHFKYTGVTIAAVTVYVTITGRYYSDLNDMEMVFNNNFPVGIMQTFVQQGNTDWIDFTFTYEQGTTISTNDEIWFHANAAGTSGLYILDILSASLIIEATIPQLAEATLGDPIEMRFSIPKNILQKDFFVSIMKLFNLFVDEDQYKEKHLVIKPFVDYYTTIEDWSDKVDRGKPIHLKPMSELNSRYYEFKYKADTDFYNDLYKKRYNEGYGDRKFDSVYEFSTNVQSLEVIFAGTPLVGYSGEEKIYSTIFKRTGNEPTTTEERVDSVIRILEAKYITGVSSWDVWNGVSIIGSYTDYPYAGHLNDPDAPSADLNFGIPQEIFFILASGNLSVNQFNVYYSSYMAEITDKDSRLLTADVKLSDIDVFNLDFAKFKYIDGCLYRLNKLIDFTPEGNNTTKAELLRVIYTTY